MWVIKNQFEVYVNLTVINYNIIKLKTGLVNKIYNNL